MSTTGTGALVLFAPEQRDGFRADRAEPSALT